MTSCLIQFCGFPSDFRESTPGSYFWMPPKFDCHDGLDLGERRGTWPLNLQIGIYYC
jgi:hypothetical protein